MTGPSSFHPVPVVGAWDETLAFRGLRLVLPPALAAAHARPGQVIKAHTDAGDGFFALASAPSAARSADLLVKRGGRVADALIAGAVPGGRALVSAPFGDGFPVEEAAGRDALLFAAGAGIAPMRALVEHVLAHRADFGRVTLFYGQRHGAEFAYRGEAPAWERGGVHVVLCPSRADDAWEGVRGRVQEVARAMAFGGSPPEGMVAFVSGMTAMVADVRRTLAQAGVPPGRVYGNL